jgi:SHOCT-like domain
MNHEERARILRMVAEGKISPVEAEDLLSALDTPRHDTRQTGTAVAMPARSEGAVMGVVAGRPLSRRSLVIQVNSPETKVNLRIPLGLARAASRFLPRQAQQSLAEYDINLGEMMENLGSAADEGTLLEVEDGDQRVRIAVE